MILLFFIVILLINLLIKNDLFKDFIIKYLNINNLTNIYNDI